MIYSLNQKQICVVAGGEKEDEPPKKRPPVEASGGGGCGNNGCHSNVNARVNIPVTESFTVSPNVQTVNGKVTGGGIELVYRF